MAKTRDDYTLTPTSRENIPADIPADSGETIVIDGRKIPGLQQSPLATALAAFQAEYPTVRKDKTALVTHDKGSYRYSYADLAEISPVVLPLLGKHGLSFSSRPMLDEHGRFVLRYELLHASGESRCGDYPLPDPSRAGAQSIGSAITYARRYALNAVTGLAPDDGSDDDGQAAAAAASSSGSSGSSNGEQPWARPPDNGGQSRDRPAGQDTKPSKKQMDYMFKLFDSAGFDNRDKPARIAFCRGQIGREIESSTEMTTREVSLVIDGLKELVPPPPEEGGQT